MDELFFSYDSLEYEAATLAYVSADLMEGSVAPHRLHQTYDICEGGNRERTERLLSQAFSEVALLLHPILEREMKGRDGFRLRLKAAGRTRGFQLRDCIREFMVAYALYGWLSLTLPEKSEVWKERCDTLRMALKEGGRGLRGTYRRKVPPI